MPLLCQTIPDLPEYCKINLTTAAADSLIIEHMEQMKVAINVSCDGLSEASLTCVLRMHAL